jgi:hypothetical protein
VIKHLKTFLALCLGLSVTFSALGLILAFGIFAFIGMPLLAIGLGLLSSAIDDV